MVTNVQANEFSPHNVLGMSSKAIYLNDPMNMAPDATDEPLTPESGQPTSSDSNEANTQAHDWEKRYGDLKSYVDKELKPQLNGFNDSINELKAQNSDLVKQRDDAKAATFKMPKTPEEYKVFSQQYPDLVANFETAILIKLQERDGKFEERFKKVEEATANNRAEKGWDLLKKYHPDADTLASDPQFQAWFSAQPPAVKALIRDPDPAVIAIGIDKYKERYNIKTPAQRVEDKRNNSRVPQGAPQRVDMNTGAKRVYKESEIDKMSDKEFEKNEPDIKQALVEGRVQRGV